MIHVLIVDDDTAKASRVSDELKKVLPVEMLRVEVAPDAAAAARVLERESIDLLVLDLSIPLRTGERASADGGSKFLEDIRRGRRMRRPQHIVGLTAYEDLLSAQQDVFAKSMWHLIHYSESDDGWILLLSEKLVHIAESLHPLGSDHFESDLGIVTAMTPIELEAVLKLPGNWQPSSSAGDDTVYQCGHFHREQRHLRVVAAAALEVGMPASTALAMKMIQRFRPRYLAMVGIAAGVTGRPGDILVADQSWDYGSGKVQSSQLDVDDFAPAPSPIPLDPLLKAKVQLFARRVDILDRIRRAWHTSVSHQLDVHIGPVASGASVLANRAAIDSIKKHQRKLIGVEMETYGIFMAARTSTKPRPLPLSIKSICDFGDEHKDDACQAYAAYTSANFLFEFALEYLVPHQLARPS